MAKVGGNEPSVLASGVQHPDETLDSYQLFRTVLDEKEILAGEIDRRGGHQIEQRRTLRETPVVEVMQHRILEYRAYY